MKNLGFALNRPLDSPSEWYHAGADITLTITPDCLETENPEDIVGRAVMEGYRLGKGVGASAKQFEIRRALGID